MASSVSIALTIKDADLHEVNNVRLLVPLARESSPYYVGLTNVSIKLTVNITHEVNEVVWPKKTGYLNVFPV